MGTTVGKESKLENLLYGLMRLEYDAIAAYELAIDRLRESKLRSAMANFNEDHLRHVRELGEIFLDLGRISPAARFRSAA